SSLDATLVGPPRMCSRQRTCTIIKSFRCKTYRKLGVGAFSTLSLVQSKPDREPNSILRQEGNINGRGNFDNLPRRRQPPSCGIDLENDNVVRQLVLRQHVFAARVDGKIPWCLSSGMTDSKMRHLAVGSIKREFSDAVVAAI